MRILSLVLVCAAVSPAIGADVVLPMSPVGQVWTKSVPSFQAAWMATEEDPFSALDRIDLKLKRFVAGHGLNQVKPLVIELPDLAWEPGKGKVRFMVPLPPDSRVLAPEGEEISIDLLDECPVVSLSFKGAYTWENIRPRMRQIAEWIQAQNRVIEGRPRLLLYHHLAFRLDWMRCAELQVPVR
ncbi:MAG: hypothetical protein IT577_11610 [Verrucomicrobiae bacterium]|nr:hypothetical protein [Verrucomicrobiae bacterium]